MTVTPTGNGSIREEFCECDPIDNPSSPMSQGDIFEWLAQENEQTNVWQQHGVIVTADCDIAHRKHRGVLSYVPLLSVSAYLNNFYIPNQVDKLQQRLVEKISELVRSLQRKNLPEFDVLLSSHDIVKWIDAVSSDSIANDLRTTAAERLQLLGLIEAREKLAGCAKDTFHCTHSISEIIASRVRLSGKNIENETRAVWAEVQSFLKNLPGDALFIRARSIGSASGHIACLRNVRELSHESVAIKPSEIAAGAKAKRVARLRAPYVYRLTQMLGNVFSSIGLPDAYELSREGVIVELQITRP